MSQEARSGEDVVCLTAVECCFWPNTAGCLGPCETEHYHDEGFKTCFSTFLAFLFGLLRTNVAAFFFVHMLVDCSTL